MTAGAPERPGRPAPRDRRRGAASRATSARVPYIGPRRSSGSTRAGGVRLSLTAVVTMVLILAFVWGGLAVILATAVRKERQKQRDGRHRAG